MRKPWKMAWNEKQFNDHISPIIRFIRSNVGRLWNDVWSEICREPVDGHFRRHVRTLVETEWLEIEKRRTATYYRGYVWFYVDENGILKESFHKPKKYSKSSTIWLNREEKIFLLKDKDIYYAIQLKELPKEIKWIIAPWDVLLKKYVYVYTGNTYPLYDHYAVSKKQLNRRELKDVKSK